MNKSNKRSGQALVEYALIVALIAGVSIYAMTQFSKTMGTEVLGSVSNVANNASGTLAKE